MHARALVDRSMIAHARDECARRFLFFSDIIYSGHMASAVRNRRCPWKLELYRVVCLPGEDCSIGGAICVRV